MELTEHYMIEIPRDLLPSYITANHIEDIQKIMKHIFIDPNFAMKSGKGYKKNGERIEEQADVSLFGHVLTVIGVYLPLVKTLDELNYNIDPELFIKSIFALAFHDLNKYLSKGSYRNINIQEVIQTIKNKLTELGLASINSENINDIADIICLIESVEEGTIGRYCKRIPLSLMKLKDNFYVVTQLMKLSDIIASESSKIPVNEIRITDIIEKEIDKIDKTVNTTISKKYKVHIFTIKKTIYHMTRYLILKSISRLIMEKGGKIIIGSPYSLISLIPKNTNIGNDEVLEVSMRTIANSIPPNPFDNRKPRPDQSSLSFPSLLFKASTIQDKNNLEKEIEQFFSDEENQNHIIQFFEKRIWIESSKSICTVNDIIEKIYSMNPKNIWLAFLLLYSISNAQLRKNLIKNIFNNIEFKLPNTRKPKKESIVERYINLCDNLTKTILSEEWLEHNRSKIINEFISELIRESSKELGFIKDHIKLHIDPIKMKYARKIDKSSVCAICGFPLDSDETELKHREDLFPYLPLKSMVSNFYEHKLKRGGEIKICKYCYAESLIRKYLLGDKNSSSNLLYIHISPNPYFPIVAVKNDFRVERYSIGTNIRVKSLDSKFINPILFEDDENKNTAFSYFLIVASDIKRFLGNNSLRNQYYFVRQIIELAKLGFRVYVTDSIDILENEKYFLSFKYLNPILTSYLGDSRFYFDEIYGIDKKIKLVDLLKIVSKKKEGEILSSLSYNILSGFSYLINSLPLKRGYEKFFLEGGYILEENVNESPYRKVLEHVKTLAEIYLETFMREIDKGSRNSRSWPIREAFDTYIKFASSDFEYLKNAIAAELIKYTQQNTNTQKSFEFANKFSNEFIKLLQIILQT